MAAQNALLKTLEEPPSASVFVLVSSMPDVLLPTVRSRCRPLRFGELTPAEVAGILVRDHRFAEAEARAAAAEAGGSVGRALEARCWIGRARRLRTACSIRRLASRIQHCGSVRLGPPGTGDTASRARPPRGPPERSGITASRPGILSTRADTRSLANTDLQADLTL